MSNYLVDIAFGIVLAYIGWLGLTTSQTAIGITDGELLIVVLLSAFMILYGLRDLVNGIEELAITVFSQFIKTGTAQKLKSKYFG